MAFWVSCSRTRAAAARASSISLLPWALAWLRTSRTLACGAGQFLLDLFRVGQAFRDALAAFFEHIQNGLVGELGEAAPATMRKLMTWAMKCGTSNPNFSRRALGGLGQVAADAWQIK